MYLYLGPKLAFCQRKEMRGFVTIIAFQIWHLGAE